VSGRQSGFTLLEVVVALAILSLSLGTLVQIFGGSARNAVAIDQYSRTVLVAESQLAMVGDGGALDSGTQEGDAAGYRWRRTVEPYTEGRWSSAAWPIRPYRVSVEVRSGAGRGPQVRLETIRLGRTESGKP